MDEQGINGTNVILKITLLRQQRMLSKDSFGN